MATKAAAHAELCRLRRDIARIEGRLAEEDRLAEAVRPHFGYPPNPAVKPQGSLELGVAPLDTILGGGLPLTALTEIRAAESRNCGPVSGFALALIARITAARKFSSVVWIGEAGLRREAGELYAPGLAAFGIDPAAIVEVAVRTEREALWAFEAALSCPGLAVAVCELRQASLDLSATRRCALRAREGGVTGLLLRLGNEWAEPSAAELRFGVAPAPAGTVGNFDAGVGRMAWRLTLEKNRLGPTGVFTVEWNAYERSFVERRERTALAHPEPLSAASSHRSPHPPSPDLN
jgi:protein ImuA